MDDPQPRLALVGQVRPVPRDHLREARDLPGGLARLDVDGLGLRLRDGGERLDLAREVGRVRGEAGEPERGGFEQREGAEDACGGEPAGVRDVSYVSSRSMCIWRYRGACGGRTIRAAPLEGPPACVGR